MTDPTVDGWTLPDDLYAAPIVLFTDEEGGTVSAYVYRDGGTDEEGGTVSAYVYRDGGTGIGCDEWDRAAGVLLSGAVDLRTIAARLVAIADTIQPPAPDPNAAEWVVADARGWVGALRRTKYDAQKRAARLDITWSEDASGGAHVGAGPMTDPALDDDKAEQAIANALDAVEAVRTYADDDIDDFLAALNGQGVVLCDEHALAELRQQAKASDTELAYDTLVAARRSRCYCAPYSKPCTECRCYADGLEDAFASSVAARQDDPR